MKGNKKVLAVALLLLLVAVSFGTYAIYKSSATSNSATVAAANWTITVNTADITTGSFNLGTITWNANANVAEGKIAPGSTGSVNLVIDATGTEVSLGYTVEVTSVKVGNTDVSNTIKIAPHTSGADTGTIAVDAANKEITIPLDIVWTAVDDNTQNPIDLGLAGQNVTVEITVTATQVY